MPVAGIEIVKAGAGLGTPLRVPGAIVGQLYRRLYRKGGTPDCPAPATTTIPAGAFIQNDVTHWTFGDDTSLQMDLIRPQGDGWAMGSRKT